MLKKIAMVASLATLVSVPLTAQAKINQNSGRTIEQVYKQCGLGGVLFGSSSEILAIISNVTWDLGTTAAISDSVSPETCNSNNIRSAVLINEAFPSVEKDLAAGQGSHLSALANVAGCESTTAIRSAYGTYAQSNAYQNATNSQNGEALYGIVNNTCSL